MILFGLRMIALDQKSIINHTLDAINHPLDAKKYHQSMIILPKSIINQIYYIKTFSDPS